MLFFDLHIQVEVAAPFPDSPETDAIACFYAGRNVHNDFLFPETVF